MVTYTANTGLPHRPIHDGVTRNTGGITVKRFVCLLLALVMVLGVCSAFGASAEEEKAAVLYNGNRYEEITFEEAADKGLIRSATSFENGFMGRQILGIDAIVYPCGKIVVPGDGAVADTDCSEYAVFFSGYKGDYYFLRLAKAGYSKLDTAAFFANSGIEMAAEAAAPAEAGMAEQGTGEIVYNGESYRELLMDEKCFDEDRCYYGDCFYLVYDSEHVYDFESSNRRMISNMPNYNSGMFIAGILSEQEYPSFWYYGDVSFSIMPYDGQLIALLLPDGQVIEPVVYESNISPWARVGFKDVPVIFADELKEIDGQDFYILFKWYEQQNDPSSSENCYVKLRLILEL